MKLLTVNFLTCAVKSCKSSPLAFPLHFRDAELERLEVRYDPALLRNMLPRLDWDAVVVTAGEVCLFSCIFSNLFGGRRVYFIFLPFRGGVEGLCSPLSLPLRPPFFSYGLLAVEN